MLEQFLGYLLSFFLPFQPILYPDFPDLSQIIGRWKPLCDLSSQEEGTLKNFTAFSTNHIPVLLHTAVPDAAPGMLFPLFAAQASAGCFGLILAA
jgi:hypothetical protein